MESHLCPDLKLLMCFEGQLQLKKEPRLLALPPLLTFIVCKRERERHVLTVIEIAGCCVKMLSRRDDTSSAKREPHDLHLVVRLIAVWIYGVVTRTSNKCNNRQARRTLDF